MKPKQEGPFAITKVLGPVTYRLKLLTSWWIHNIFHATLLKPYRENEIYWENFTEPPPELVEGEEVYEVKTIHGHRKQGQGYQYYIQWQGYPISDARTCIFWWWQNIGWLQKTPPPLTFLLSPSRHMFPYLRTLSFDSRPGVMTSNDYEIINSQSQRIVCSEIQWAFKEC